jgi:hypothetical protein
MFNNLFCINLVKKDQNSLKSCVELFFLNFVVFVFINWLYRLLMRGIKHVCQTGFRHIFNFMFSRRFFATNSFEIFQNQIILFALILKVITSICNETIFHLIVKSTVDILCGSGLYTKFFCWQKWSVMAECFLIEYNDYM